MPADHMSCQPPRNLHSRIHFGLEIHVMPEGPAVGSIMGTDKMIVGDNPETNSITKEPETTSHVAKQFCWVPLPCCSPPCSPFPKKPLPLSACVSPGTIHFPMLDKSPLSDPARSPPFCNRWRLWWDFLTGTDALTIQVLRDKLVR